ncbi:MAG: PSD1 domain-containing protein [Chlorobia bacterium]|nr:PSD1 domain-containing protein [Fimbriimonadaceae bacterium]
MKAYPLASKYHTIAAITVAGSCLMYGAFASPTAQSPVDFQHDVLPIFKAHCMPCHSAKDKAGGLNLDSFQGLQKGGVSGASVVKTKADQSLLLTRILGKGHGPRMPMGFKPLTDQDANTIRKWIDEGANAVSAGGPKRHWAFVAPVRAKTPITKNKTWPRNPVDAFILARLEREGLKPSPEADKVTLIRRLTLDLIGLPPTPSEVDAFIADKSHQAYEKVVDRLLATRHYGERMALPWLDAARYADSNGFQQDGDTHQYVWRDWVVDALNANMPFDQFTTEQLAGDLLPDPTLAQLIATGFNRNHMLNGEGGAIAEEQRNVILYDRVDTTSTTWLGLTMACARCHDHKYDPLSQKDFYSFLAFFNSVPESGVPSGGGQYRIADPWVYVPSAEQKRELEALELEFKSADPAAQKVLKPKLDNLRAAIPRVMVMSDKQPRKTFVQNRGNYEEPLDEVQPATPTSLPKIATKNRLDLAKWVTSKQNPLTARVQVNRYWQTFFGRGLVRTEENFGIKGEVSTHPELLDWLAVDFRENGWNVKRLHKMIVMSATYRQSSKLPASLKTKDPSNLLYARAPRFRMPSMILRDVALASSGLLDPKMGGKPVYPYQPKGIWDGLAITLERDFTYPQSKGDENHRRSLYTFWRRTVAPGNMFDASSRQVCTVRASLTSTPLHALTMLNDVTWVEAARGLAAQVISLPTNEGRLREAFRRVCARRPTENELKVLLRSLQRSKQAFNLDPAAAKQFLAQGDSPLPPNHNPTDLAALASVCLAIYNLDEAMTRE